MYAIITLLVFQVDAKNVISEKEVMIMTLRVSNICIKSCITLVLIPPRLNSILVYIIVCMYVCFGVFVVCHCLCLCICMYMWCTCVCVSVHLCLHVCLCMWKEGVRGREGERRGSE